MSSRSVASSRATWCSPFAATLSTRRACIRCKWAPDATCLTRDSCGKCCTAASRTCAAMWPNRASTRARGSSRASLSRSTTRPPRISSQVASRASAARPLVAQTSLARRSRKLSLSMHGQNSLVLNRLKLIVRNKNKRE